MGISRAPKVADFLPKPRAWQVEPIVRTMLDLIEQHLLDCADRSLNEDRFSVASAIDMATRPLDLIIVAIGRKHPDRDFLCEVHSQLLNLRELLHAFPRPKTYARLGEIAALLMTPDAAPRADAVPTKAAERKRAAS